MLELLPFWSDQALHNLTELDSDYMVSHVLPRLLNNVKSIDASTRHGSIIAIGEIVHALHLKTGLIMGELDRYKELGVSVRHNYEFDTCIINTNFFFRRSYYQ